MTPSQKLFHRLRVLGVDLPEDTEIRRIYAGRWMKATGCWSWFAYSQSQDINVGSQWTVSYLLRSEALEIAVNEFGETGIAPRKEPKL